MPAIDEIRCRAIECDLVVLGHYTNIAPGVEPVTSGHWDDISYDGLTDTTTFTDFGATFPAQAVNWWLQPHAARSTYLPILGVGFSQIIVAGNATNLASGLLPFELGSFYTIVWPAGVDPHTGTLAHDDPCNPVSRLLWAGYFYMPPVAGTKIAPNGTVGTTTYGAQPGGNHTGDYSCWNRIYNPTTGRWTTPDPAASPWWNLRDYIGGRPLNRIDSTGLEGANATVAGAEARAKAYAAWADENPKNAWLQCVKHVGEEVAKAVKDLDTTVRWGRRANWFMRNPVLADQYNALDALKNWLLGFGAELYKEARVGIPLLINGVASGGASEEWRKAAVECGGGGDCFITGAARGGVDTYYVGGNPGSRGNTKECCEAMTEAEQAPGSRWVDADEKNRFPGVPVAGVVGGWIGFKPKPYEGMDLDMDVFKKPNKERVDWAKELCCRDEVIKKFE